MNTANVYYCQEHHCWDILWGRGGCDYGFATLAAVTDYIERSAPGTTIHVYAARWI